MAVSFFVKPARLADGLEAKNPPQIALLRPCFAVIRKTFGSPAPHLLTHGFGVDI
jgi:hypothetical protein